MSPIDMFNGATCIVASAARNTQTLHHCQPYISHCQQCINDSYQLT